MRSQRLEAQFREWEREEEERRQAKALTDSHEELLNLIDEWARVKNLNCFFDEVEEAIQKTEGEGQESLLERINLARDMVGQGDALASLKAWKTPSERLKIIKSGRN